MEEYKMSMVEECEQLRTRLHKILFFMNSKEFQEADAAEKDRVFRQAGAMATYADALCARIEAMQKPKPVEPVEPPEPAFASPI